MDQRYQQELSTTDTATQRNPRQRGKRSCTTCSCCDGMGAQASNEVCGTLDERAGGHIPTRHSNQVGGVRENRARLREPINKDRRRRYEERRDDTGNGGHASQRANQMREEILDITRRQQHIDSQPMQMQLGANPKSKGKDKDIKGQGKRQGRQG